VTADGIVDAPSRRSLAAVHDVALLDLDGVVYIGDHAVSGAAEALASAAGQGMRLAFVTNNAARPPEDVAAHLVALGIPARDEDVVTSAQAGAEILASRLAPGELVLAVGGPGVALSLERSRLTPVRPDDPRAGEVRAVMQGFGRDVAWKDLAAAALAVQRGAVWVVTNPDVTLPVPGGTAPGNGSLARAVESAAGRPPDEIAGKPHPALMRVAIARSGAQRPLAVGDRLDTDIAGAMRTGCSSLLVLTGIADTTALLLAGVGERPDFIGADLAALVQPPAPTGGPDGPRRESDGWRLGPSRAWTEEGRLRVEVGGDWLAALQCACAAAWSLPLPPRVDAAVAALDQARHRPRSGARTVDP
jgi:glycerol-1-phosphatase